MNVGDDCDPSSGRISKFLKHCDWWLPPTCLNTKLLSGSVQLERSRRYFSNHSQDYLTRTHIMSFRLVLRTASGV